MSEYTEGPWLIGYKHNRTFVSGETSAVAEVLDTKDMLPSELEANANLVAAAPELLQACECGAPKSGPALLRIVAELLESYRNSPTPINPKPMVIEALRCKADLEEKAIAKARGRNG